MGKTDGPGGFTLFEVILAVCILTVAIVPIVSAYRPALFSVSGQERQAICANRARQTLGRVVSLDFDTLWGNQGSPVNLSNLFAPGDETFSLDGVSVSPAVSINDASGGAGGLVEISVTAGDVTLKALKAAR